MLGHLGGAPGRPCSLYSNIVFGGYKVEGEMIMRCEERDEYVSDADCVDCEYADCEHHQKVIEKALDLERLRASDLSKAIRERLANLLGLPGGELDKMVATVFVNVQEKISQQIVLCVNDIAQRAIVTQIDKAAEGLIKAEFENAVQRDVLDIAAKPEQMDTSIQKVVVKKIREFLSEYYDRDKKRKIAETIEEAISTLVGDKVDAALEELKEETIDKWNKDIVKTMMAGMVGAIKKDKRLMAAIGQTE
jgi:hypothetical protein